MCGIVGLFLKNKELEPDLGRLTALMLKEMRDRGPDSAGFAVYGDEVGGHQDHPPVQDQRDRLERTCQRP